MLAKSSTGWQLTVIGLLDVDAMLREREREVVHGEHDAVAVHGRRGAATSGSRTVHAQLGKVERVAREIADELLRREGEQALPGICQYSVLPPNSIYVYLVLHASVVGA